MREQRQESEWIVSCQRSLRSTLGCIKDQCCHRAHDHDDVKTTYQCCHRAHDHDDVKTTYQQLHVS